MGGKWWINTWQDSKLTLWCTLLIYILGILNLLFGRVYVNLPTYDQHYFQDSRLHALKSLPPDPISYRSVQLLTWSGTKFWTEKIWVIICSLKLSIKQKQFANLSRGMQTESYYNANKLTSHSTFMHEYITYFMLITLESVPWTNQYWAKRVKFLAQENNVSLWWLFKLSLTDIHQLPLHHVAHLIINRKVYCRYTGFLPGRCQQYCVAFVVVNLFIYNSVHTYNSVKYNSV